jgi:hypothetical protein
VNLEGLPQVEACMLHYALSLVAVSSSSRSSIMIKEIFLNQSFEINHINKTIINNVLNIISSIDIKISS